MDVLILGGSQFLSRAIASSAIEQGHRVVCANRGISGEAPPGAEEVRWDRADELPQSLRDRHFDAVVDVSRIPSQVRSAVDAFPAAHWIFISTVSTYADNATEDQTVTAPLLAPLDADEDPASGPEVYGRMKVACEDHVRAGAPRALILRPGLIVGPGDPTGRFSYWPVRLAEPGPVLAPGDPGDLVQVIDVRDLAEWVVAALAAGLTGTFDAVGLVTPLGELLAEVACGVGVDHPELRWIAAETLARNAIEPWSGDSSVPLWLPRPDFNGMLTHDPGPSLAAGLVLRPIAETARDTLAWYRRTEKAAMTGISREREAEVLAAD